MAVKIEHKKAKGASMGRQQLGIAFFLALCAVVFAATATVPASSESFPLVESASVSRDVFANEGDHLVGNFTIFNIPTWTDSNTGNPETVEYTFKITKSEGPEKCPHETELYGSYQKKQASFDVYCEYTGSYRLRFNVGICNPTVGIGSMKATLNYDVVKSSTGDQPNKTPSPPIPELSAWLVLPLGATITVVVLIVRKKKESRVGF
jgi:hypothetical protein